jgi:hypothetical protein
MSHRISIENAKEMRLNEIESQENAKKGIKPKVSRREKKRRMRLSKTERFIEMLKKRGGYLPHTHELEDKVKRKGNKKYLEG